MVFTGDEFGDGARHITKVLQEEKVKASFFLTGNFYQNPAFSTSIKKLRSNGHYLGAHSDKHLLYCAWTNRDSLLVTKTSFLADLEENYRKMEHFGITKKQSRFFLPPYEWYNDSISTWTKEASLSLVNFTPGTRSNADYTTPTMKNYKNSKEIFESIIKFEQTGNQGLNGFILLLHIGTSPERTDKFYDSLRQLIHWLQKEGYTLERIDELLRDAI